MDNQNPLPNQGNRAVFPEPQYGQPATGPSVIPRQNPQPISPPPSNPIKPPVHHDSNVVEKSEQILTMVYIFVTAMLLFRFVLSLFGANRDSLFVDFVYQLTSPFMIPFSNMFGGPIGVDRYIIEFEIPVALLVYALVFFGIARLIRVIFK